MRWGSLVLGGLAALAVSGQGQGEERASAGVTLTPTRSCLERVVLDPVSLTEVLGLAFRENPRVVSAQQDVEKAKANETGVTAAFLPSVSASLQGERFLNESPGNNPVTTVGSTVVGGQVDQYTNYPSLGANWNLFNGGRDLAAYRAARAGTRASGADLAGQRNDTLSAVLSAYSDLVKAQALFTQRASALKIREAMVVRARERFQRGNGTLIALNQARIARAQTEREVSKACRDVLDKSAALAQAIGIRLPVGHALTITKPLPDVPRASFDQAAIEALIESDPAVAGARERQEAAQHKLDQARGALYPTLALMARYDWLGQKTESYSYAWHDTHPNSYRFGFVLQQPLFPYAAYNGGMQSAEADVAKAQAAYRDAVIAVDSRLRGAMSAKEQSDADEASAGRSAQEARQALLLSQALYARGQADLDTVDRARLDAAQEEEAEQEAGADKALNDWLAYRALHPNDFAPTVLDAAGGAPRKPAPSR